MKGQCVDQQVENEEIEISLLLEAIYLKYGYDFRGYARAHIKRRIMHQMALADLSNLSELQHKILYDRGFFYKILPDFSINVTEMFRDPSFYMTLRREVIPILKKYPAIKIWHAGCSTGEEVYSMAILLQEEGVTDNVQIYATDFNEAVLAQAQQGIYPISSIKEYTYNYQRAGGSGSFADYYTSQIDSVKIDASLKKNIVFADHNLVTDGVFGEMNMIICRNVLIYFTRKLQNQVIGLFVDSLCPRGFLGLGSKETIRFCEHAHKFESIAEEEKIYRKLIK